MGIDVGYLDLVCQLGSPRSIATFLQRVGRSGHSLGLVPKGRLFPLSRDELLECLAVIRSVRRGRLDAIEIPAAPLDILAQQIVAAVAADEWEEDELFALCRRAWPFRELTREDFEAAVGLVTQGADPKTGRGAHLHRDRINGRLRARRGARIAAITSGGAIPEVADYRVVTEEDGTFVGTLNEDFAIESQAGDVFQLGNMSWRIRYVRGGEVVVQDAQGAPATVPFWLGEAPGARASCRRKWRRCAAKSHRASRFRPAGRMSLRSKVAHRAMTSISPKPPAGCRPNAAPTIGPRRKRPVTSLHKRRPYRPSPRSGKLFSNGSSTNRAAANL